MKVKSTNKLCIFILGRLLMVRIKKLLGLTNNAGSTSLSKISDSVTFMLICVCIMFAVTTTPYATLYSVNADVTTVRQCDYYVSLCVCYVRQCDYYVSLCVCYV